MGHFLRQSIHWSHRVTDLWSLPLLLLLLFDGIIGIDDEFAAVLIVDILLLPLPSSSDDGCCGCCCCSSIIITTSIVSAALPSVAPKAICAVPTKRESSQIAQMDPLIRRRLTNLAWRNIKRQALKTLETLCIRAKEGKVNGVPMPLFVCLCTHSTF